MAAQGIVVLFLLPPVLPFMVLTVCSDEFTPLDRTVHVVLILALTAWWCTVFVPMLRPSPRVRRILVCCPVLAAVA